VQVTVVDDVGVVTASVGVRLPTAIASVPLCSGVTDGTWPFTANVSGPSSGRATAGAASGDNGSRCDEVPSVATSSVSTPAPTSVPPAARRPAVSCADNVIDSAMPVTGTGSPTGAESGNAASTLAVSGALPPCGRAQEPVTDVLNGRAPASPALTTTKVASTTSPTAASDAELVAHRPDRVVRMDEYPGLFAEHRHDFYR
jgi:hypothetical protein